MSCLEPTKSHFPKTLGHHRDGPLGVDSLLQKTIISCMISSLKYAHNVKLALK
jgi:hypothetical protein